MTIFKISSAHVNVPPNAQRKRIRGNNYNTWLIDAVKTGFRGRTLTLFVHEPSRICVLTNGKSIVKCLPEFETRLMQLLKRSSFPADIIEQFQQSFTHHSYQPIQSKRVLKQVEAIKMELEHSLLRYHSFDEIDLNVIENNLLDKTYTHHRNLYTPSSWWNAYLSGEDPYSDYRNLPDSLLKVKSSPYTKNGLTKEEELYMENQMIRMDIEQQLGKPVHLNMLVENEETPLELENELLKHIRHLELTLKDVKEVTLYEYLGKPKIKDVHLLTEKQLQKELVRLYKLLTRHQVSVDFIGEYPLVIMYTFIAEELMQKKVPNVKLPGIMARFVYEMFHPNHTLALEHLAEYFVSEMLLKDDGSSDVRQLLQDGFILNEEEADDQKLIELFNTFKIIHEVTGLADAQLTEPVLNADETTGSLEVVLFYKNKIKGKRRLKFTLQFEFVRVENNWLIKAIQFNY
ncbi:MAG: DUF6933 domain-containing protein [Bacteroidota bacterium]